MLDFMRAGGLGMWFILALGLVTLSLALSFAWRPEERKLALIRPLSVATTFATLANLCAGLAATMKFVAAPPPDANVPMLVMMGIGESLSNPVLGFGLLMAAWLLAAAGLRRQL